MTGKVLLFYKYVHLENPQKILKWQKQICTDLGLTGRVLLGTEGINATLGGTTQSIDRYKATISKYPLFTGIDFKESPGGAECFPRLRIVIRKEIVSLGVEADKLTPAQGGTHLTPDETHELIKSNPDDLVILDTRNDYEWKVGTFKGAITPPIKNFRDFPEYIDKNIDDFKNKRVLMFCTGGIRCERATAYLKEKNISKEVMQIDGGIHRYAEKHPDGFFRGKNYVFDGRIALKINDDIVGSCELCEQPCDDYTNCLNALCNKHFIGCANCLAQLDNTCSPVCQNLVAQAKVAKREPLNKVISTEK